MLFYYGQYIPELYKEKIANAKNEAASASDDDTSNTPKFDYNKYKNMQQNDIEQNLSLSDESESTMIGKMSWFTIGNLGETHSVCISSNYTDAT